MSDNQDLDYELGMFGLTVRRLRRKRSLTIPMLTNKINAVLAKMDWESASIFGEAQLQRIETGRTKKISQKMVAVIAEALECSERERMYLFACLNRHIIVENGNDLDISAEFYCVISFLYSQCYDFLKIQNSNKPFKSLDDESVKILVLTILQNVINENMNS